MLFDLTFFFRLGGSIFGSGGILRFFLLNFNNGPVSKGVEITVFTEVPQIRVIANDRHRNEFYQEFEDFLKNYKKFHN